MNRILKIPAINAICISLFTLFYAMVFFVTSKNTEFKSFLYYSNSDKITNSFWKDWSDFLASGYHAYIALVLIAITVLVVVLLITRRHSYDEYHTSILTHCLITAVILTLLAIAVFYLLILHEPAGIIEKFTLFIVIHWTTVVIADLTYILICRWR